MSGPSRDGNDSEEGIDSQAGESGEPPWKRHDPAWPVHDSVVVWETPFFDAGYDVVERPDGERADFYWLEPADAAIVIAVDDGEVVVVEQYRPRYRMHSLGLPGGGVDEGEDPATAARRELREETGYRTERITHVESYVPSGWTRYVRHVFVAEGLEVGEQDTDEGEYISVDTVPADDVLDVVRDRDGPTIGGVLTPLLLAREDGHL